MLKSNLLFNFIFILISFVTEVQAQYSYHHVFNPEKGFVSKVEKPYREELCLNGKWQFMPVYENDIRKFQKPENFKWDQVSLKIPSPWNVNSFAQGDGGDFVTFPSYPKAWEKAQMGWMKKDFVLPEGWANKELLLHFEAIAGYAKIYINGQLVKEGLNIFLPTEVDITSYVKRGNNEILVGVAKASLTDVSGKYGRRNYVAGSFWGQHIAGIWQDVSLIALPKLHISNVFVNPDVKDDELDLAVSIRNNTSVTQQAYVDASVRVWWKPATKDINLAPVDNGMLKKEVLHMESSGKLIIKAGDSLTVHLHKKVDGRLQYWTPDAPNLYGAVISLNATNKRKVIDIKYTRFGWRQFRIDGTRLLLNGKPIILKGDAWHFMGIPQMTRRYAWGWFKMLKDANANAVRLHAQPYPSFYLDVADEMGICVLDETGIWASDGGPKIDSEEYWKSCKEQVRDLVLRDRNHPSVFGWSVCNENLPVDLYVFHAPDSLVQRNIQEINNWIKIVQELDPSRDWISGDGDTQRPTNLPTVIGHYGDGHAMEQWSSEGKPWGMGEAGMAYFGTPKQVSVFNGNRAYESQEGRMEGLAMEAYGLIREEQKFHAVYTSVFNLVWYGLKPLPLGLKDITRAPQPKDGIFFPEYKEGIPGVQPERIGPYTTTINPGYDPRIPLYEPWPLFYAVQAANAIPVRNFKIAVKPELTSISPDKADINNVEFIGSTDSSLRNWLESLGVPFVVGDNSKPKMLIIDGKTATFDNSSESTIKACLQSGGKVLIWGVAPDKLKQLNKILPYPLSLTNRNATSFIVQHSDALLSSLGNKDFYFTEMTRQPVMRYGLSGEFVQHGKVLVTACNTDWSRWNSQPEYLKTAAVYRSEQEAKAGGAAIVKLGLSQGCMYITSIDLMLLKPETEDLVKTLFSNLGVVLKTIPSNQLQALSARGNLERAMVLKGNEVSSEELMTTRNQDFEKKYESGNHSVVIQANMNGFLNLGQIIRKEKQPEKDKNIYLSFWLNSPRSLVDLLVEPDMPKLDMKIDGTQNIKVCINGSVVLAGNQVGKSIKFENLPLNKGWNHILLQYNIEPNSYELNTRVSFESNKNEFINQLNSSLEQ